MVTKPPPGALGALALGLGISVVAACGGRIDPSSVAPCSAPAVAYCQENGCPLTGPTSNATGSVLAWCQASPAFASRVMGVGTCTTTAGVIWATAVKASDGSGGALYVLYDPSSGQLLSASTVDPVDAAAAGTDGGTSETDYGSCGQHSGIVTCSVVDRVPGCGA